jgi:aspartyl protease family protein
LTRPVNDTVFTAPVTINGIAAGTFVVDTGASLVVLSRAVAEKLRLDLNGAPLLFAQTANGVSTGTGKVLDNVDVHGLRTSHVPAAIADGLGDVDGLLGMSFLTRFELWQDGAKLRISTRKR